MPMHERRARRFYGVAYRSARSNRFWEALHADLNRMAWQRCGIGDASHIGSNRR
jgi:hypothetical protein